MVTRTPWLERFVSCSLLFNQLFWNILNLNALEPFSALAYLCGLANSVSEILALPYFWLHVMDILREAPQHCWTQMIWTCMRIRMSRVFLDSKLIWLIYRYMLIHIYPNSAMLIYAHKFGEKTSVQYVPTWFEMKWLVVSIVLNFSDIFLCFHRFDIEKSGELIFLRNKCH